MSWGEALGAKTSKPASSGSSGWASILPSAAQAPKPTFTPVPYQLPMPSIGGIGKSTPQTTTETDTRKFFAEIAGAPLRAGLSVGLDVQNLLTKGAPPASINPRDELGNYAAYFLGDEPINALSSDYQAAIQGSGQDNPISNFINLVGTAGGAALNILPVYGALAEKGAQLASRKFILKPIADLSGGEAVNVRRFQNLPVSGKSVLSPIDIKTAYTPDAQLPVIDYGKSPKKSPTVQIGAPEATAPGGYKYVPIGNGLELPVRTSTPELKPLLGPRNLRTAPQTPTGVGGVVSKGAKDAQALAAEAGMRSLPEERLARTNPITFKSQEEKIRSLLGDVEELKRMASDPRKVPADVELPALFNASIDYAQKTKNWQLLADLSASRLATASTEAGRTLGATKIFQNPAVKAIQEIKKAREVTFKGQAAKIRKVDSVAIDKEIARQPNNWESFVDSITCDS